MEERLEDIARHECLELMRTQSVGRIAVIDGYHPFVVPVNYVMAGEHIVFRSGVGTKLDILRRRPVGFEVDHIDAADRTGWSVYVIGVAREVDVEFAADLLRRMPGPMPEPWAGGDRNHLVQLVPQRVTGRRILAPLGSHSA